MLSNVIRQRKKLCYYGEISYLFISGIILTPIDMGMEGLIEHEIGEGLGTLNESKTCKRIKRYPENRTAMLLVRMNQNKILESEGVREMRRS